MRSLRHNRLPALGLTCLAIGLLCGCQESSGTKTESHNSGIKTDSQLHLILNRQISQSNYVTIPVTIEDQEFTFILDTGSNATVIDKRLKHLFGESVKQGITASTLDGDLQLEAVAIKSLIIKDKIAVSGYVGVCDLSKFGGMAGHYDGIIGMGSLRSFALLLDFENNRIEFTNDLDVLRNEEFACSIDLLPDDERLRPFVTMRLGDVSEEFLIDTGVPGTSFLRNDTFDMIGTRTKQHTIMLDTLGGQKEGKAIGIDAFLGKLKYPSLAFIREDSSILGLQFLRYHKRVVFDFIGWQMHLAPRWRICLHCGYNPMGNVSGVCPKCGEQIWECETGTGSAKRGRN